jgi:queuine/archaeosine tRNA-ribosyltransferase
MRKAIENHTFEEFKRDFAARRSGMGEA